MLQLASRILIGQVYNKKIFVGTEEVDVTASLQFVGLIPVVFGFNKDVKNLVPLGEFLNFYM